MLHTMDGCGLLKVVNVGRCAVFVVFQSALCEVTLGYSWQ